MLAYTLIDDPAALYWVAGLLAVGLVLYLLERFFGKKQLRPPGAERGDPEAAEPPPIEQGALSHAFIVATDGSRASLVGARQFKWIADSREITDVTVVAVVSPYAAVPFANELGPHRTTELTELSFADEAETAVDSSRRSSTAGGRPSTSRSAAAPRPRRSSGRPRTWTPT